MRWVTLGLNEVQQTRSTDRQPSATKYRYLDAVRALGPTAGQCISRPRIHRPLADGLFDSESSEEDPELWAGRLQVTTHRLSYDSLTQPNKPTPEETLEVTQALPHTRSVLGVTTYYSGQSKTRRWYIDGSKRHVRPGASNSNGDFRAAFRVHGPQQVYRAETTACAVASDLARGRDRAPQPGGGEGQSSSPQGRGSPWRTTPYVPPRRAGGFGVFAAEDDQGPQVRFCGYVPTRHRQTNNGAELSAAVEALQGFWVPKTGNPHRLAIPAAGSDWQGPALEIKGMDNHVRKAAGPRPSPGNAAPGNGDAGTRSQVGQCPSSCQRAGK